MARLCTFSDIKALNGSLSVSWGLCLHYLSGYKGISSIAKKSSHLLEESAKQLLSSDHLHKASTKT